MSEIIINKNNKSITFINNGIGFSQFEVADEILDLINNLQTQLQQKENIIKEVREYVKQTGQYLEDIKRFKVDVLESNYLDILEILDKENK